jgi:hypothetical protein
MNGVYVFGVSLLNRASDGGMTLVSYHPRRSTTWHWSVSLVRSSAIPHRAPHRTGQWHDYYWLPFGWRLVVSQQDYHLGR